ncbi:hypothetical protein E1A91_D09G188900v1 [Gossypium mustelinum]|uniref:UDP-glycosyltransferases domain-containing protein n=1 Tax=Gossypium mustelinum TaxID=34275 RepID=A0A5D2TMJ9_GOSMU|nr:hypothetical protein E1A91_D09G188900v1 [Gossypium mustelinum]
MSSQSSKLHFVFIPLMCPGHIIPMVDMGRLLAQHGVTVTIAGLPEGCENIDALPSRLLSKNFMDAVGMLQQPLERFLEETEPKPSCIISDRHHPWTFGVAQKFKIPRLAFDGTSCFTVTCSHFINLSKIHEKVSDDLEPFVVPSLPDMIELTKGQLPNDLNPRSVVLKVKEEDIVENMRVADMASYGLVVNSFEELEPRFVTIIELVLGLEASNRPFIWVVRKGYKSDEFNKWLSEEGFEERNKGRGLLIHGWAPQLSILSHTVIGGFMNEKLVVQVLGIGERVGADIAMKWGEEEPYGVMVKREEITKTINLVMDSGNEGEERRKRAMKLQVLANKAFENKGSSCLNVKRLIKDISQISGTKD